MYVNERRILLVILYGSCLEINFIFRHYFWDEIDKSVRISLLNIRLLLEIIVQIVCT